MPRASRRYVVGSPEDVPPGKRVLVDVAGLGKVGIFNIQGEYFAVRNVCPHMGGPMCLGKLTGTTQPRFEEGRRPELEWVRVGEILRCPWHGWEFDIRTGKALFNDKTHVITYEVRVGTAEGGNAAAEPSPPDAETYPVRVQAERLILEVPRRGNDAHRKEVTDAR